jgi:hypothetical protein
MFFFLLPGLEPDQHSYGNAIHYCAIAGDFVNADILFTKFTAADSLPPPSECVRLAISPKKTQNSFFFFFRFM